MQALKWLFEEKGYEVLSISKNRKGELIVRTERGEFKDCFPLEFTQEDVQKVKGIFAS